MDEESLNIIGHDAVSVLEQLLGQVETVLVLGALPRLSGDPIGCKWEHTAGYHMERRLVHRLPKEVRYCKFGRQLTKKVKGRHAMTEGNAEWYALDRTHLSMEGYEKLADANEFPVWLTMSGSATVR